MPVLVLNSSLQPLSIIPERRLIVLLSKQKVTFVDESVRELIEESINARRLELDRLGHPPGAGEAGLGELADERRNAAQRALHVLRCARGVDHRDRVAGRRAIAASIEQRTFQPDAAAAWQAAFARFERLLSA